jgi:hypothetical protein
VGSILACQMQNFVSVFASPTPPIGELCFFVLWRILLLLCASSLRSSLLSTDTASSEAPEAWCVNARLACCLVWHSFFANRFTTVVA